MFQHKTLRGLPEYFNWLLKLMLHGDMQISMMAEERDFLCKPNISAMCTRKTLLTFLHKKNDQ